MRVVVIGANGQLGTDVCAVFQGVGHAVNALTHAHGDIRDAAAIERAISGADVVVNTAAMHNVEACEADPTTAHAVNADGAGNVARACRRQGAALVHISTDYVFDGTKQTPYTESDVPNPLSVYGRTKLEGEARVRDTLAEHFVVRTSGLYGLAPCRAKPSGNFVQLMLRLARERGEVRVVTDEMVTPTYTSDLARQILALCDARAFGLYHATSQGETSWFDFASATFDLVGLTPRMHAAGVKDFPAKAPRPKYSVLDNAALASTRIDVMPHWRDSLRSYLTAVRENP